MPSTVSCPLLRRLSPRVRLCRLLSPARCFGDSRKEFTFDVFCLTPLHCIVVHVHQPFSQSPAEQPGATPRGGLHDVGIAAGAARDAAWSLVLCHGGATPEAALRDPEPRECPEGGASRTLPPSTHPGRRSAPAMFTLFLAPRWTPGACQASWRAPRLCARQRASIPFLSSVVGRKLG